MTRKLTALLILVAFTTTILALPAVAEDSGRTPGRLAIPVTNATASSAELGIPTGSPFTGNFIIHRFVAEQGTLFAIGTLVGTAGGTDVVFHNVQAPVVARSISPATASLAGAPSGFQLAQAACPILNLTIGPIHLNLLGLVVDVPNPIVVNIVAQPGQGNLLGNLLCAVANLLNQTPTGQGILNQIATLLNRILAALGGAV